MEFRSLHRIELKWTDILSQNVVNWAYNEINMNTLLTSFFLFKKRKKDEKNEKKLVLNFHKKSITYVNILHEYN